MWIAPEIPGMTNHPFNPLQQSSFKAMAKKSFEFSLARLEEITAELEDGELSLDKSLKKFEEGIQLARFCNEQLAEARAKVELLLDKDGQLVTVPFNESDSEYQQLSK